MLASGCAYFRAHPGTADNFLEKDFREKDIRNDRSDRKFKRISCNSLIYRFIFFTVLFTFGVLKILINSGSRWYFLQHPNKVRSIVDSAPAWSVLTVSFHSAPPCAGRCRRENRRNVKRSGRIEFWFQNVLYFFCIPELRCSVKVDGCTAKLFCCRKALVGVLRLNYAIALFSATAILNWLGAYILRFNLWCGADIACYQKIQNRSYNL